MGGGVNVTRNWIAKVVWYVVPLVYFGGGIEKSTTSLTRGEFNNASARRALVDWYLSLFIMCKA